MTYTVDILIDKPTQLKNNVLVKYSAYIKFDYNIDIIKYIQNMSIRKYDTNTKVWEIPYQDIIKLCNNLPQFDYHIHGIYKNVSKLYNNCSIPETYEFKLPPFSHQMDAINFGLNINKFILADEQGLGKTATVIHIANCRQDVNKVLIVCGVNSLKYNWQIEISAHSNEKSMILGQRTRKNGNVYEGNVKDKLYDLDNIPDDVKFIITNIETLRSGTIKEKRGKRTIYHFPIADKLKELCDNDTISMIALDECHKCKNSTSLQGQAMLQLQSKYMIAMSGTPLMNTPLDLYFPLYWLGYEDHSLFMFKQHYCVLGGYNNTEILCYKNLTQLQDILEQIMIRRTKSEVLDLPEKIHTVEYVDMTSKQTKIYNEILDNVRHDINKIVHSNNPLSMLIRLRQATGYTGILSDTIKESAKLNRLKEIVDDQVLNNNKVVVFSQWSSITEAAKDTLKDYNIAYITGETESNLRNSEIKKFIEDDDCKIMIATIGVMGTGFTLTVAQTAVFLDSPWNRAIKDQAEDRLHRIGTKGTVNIITLVCKNTIDERIEDLVYKKGVLSDSIIDGKNKQTTLDIINQLIR